MRYDSIHRGATARRLMWAPLFFVAAACISACAEKPRQPRPAPPPPTAEERFDNLVQALKRQFNNIDPLPPSMSDYNSPAGVPVTSSKTTVEHELIPPSEEGQPYRAVVTLNTRSTVTVVLPFKEKEEDETPGDEDQETDGQAAGVSPSSDTIDRLGNSPIRTVPHEDVRRLELEFQEGKWVLLTEIDEENEPFTAAALDYALMRQ